MGKLAVRQRWDPAQLEIFDAAVRRGDPGKSARDGILPTSPFGETEMGAIDFRGGVELRRPLHRVTADSVDFSFAILAWGGGLQSCTLSRCTFDVANLGGRWIGTKFTDCSFRRASLTGSNLVGEFIGCDFSAAGFSQARSCGGPGGYLRFIDCDFRNADLRRVNLRNCVFEACNFEGARFHYDRPGPVLDGGIPVNGSTVVHCRFVGCGVSPDMLGNAFVESTTFG